MTKKEANKTNIGDAERVAAFMLTFIVYGAFALFVLGIIMQVLGVNAASTDESFSIRHFYRYLSAAPNSYVFYGVATSLILATPLLVPLVSAVVFIRNKEFKMATVPILLLTVFLVGIASRL
ncbi:hypothetical protein AGMMS49941_11680 [Deferribacterales bacterium]|nr:hypothetical protein AGMMS49941_11680 [Deferribacterales bacterium]